MERNLQSSEVILISLRYGNQAEVAEGLKKAFKEIPGLKREDVFIVRFACYLSVFGLLTCFFWCKDLKAMEQVRLPMQLVTPLLLTSCVVNTALRSWKQHLMTACKNLGWTTLMHVITLSV